MIIIAAFLMILPAVKAAEVLTIAFSSEYNPFELDGKTVTVTGYVSSLYPSHGSWIYLVDQPYRNSPFYTSETTPFNGILVKAKEKDWIPYTDLLIKVTGKLMVNEGTDEKGNPYYFEIVNATYQEVTETDLGAVHKAYYFLIKNNIIPAVNKYLEQTLAALKLDNLQMLATSAELNQLITRIRDLDSEDLAELISIVVEIKTANAGILAGKETEDVMTDNIYHLYLRYLEWLARFKI